MITLKCSKFYELHVVERREGKWVIMTKPPSRDWRMLPDLIFSDVMMKIVLESFESLHRCRQVCKAWNERILSNIWENPSKRDIIKTKIEKTWETGKISDDEISHARWLGRYEFIA